MPVFSIVAIYFLFYFLCLFLVLPFGVRTADEAGVAKVRGQADSAPHGFRFGMTALRTALVAAVPTALFVLNYHHGWITRDSFDTILVWLGQPQV